jgi:hypothetical protein
VLSGLPAAAPCRTEHWQCGQCLTVFENVVGGLWQESDADVVQASVNAHVGLGLGVGVSVAGEPSAPPSLSAGARVVALAASAQPSGSASDVDIPNDWMQPEVEHTLSTRAARKVR